MGKWINVGAMYSSRYNYKVYLAAISAGGSWGEGGYMLAQCAVPGIKMASIPLLNELNNLKSVKFSSVVRNEYEII